MSCSNAASFELFSLNVKYEQACQKQSEAIARNLRLRKDFSSIKLKLVSSCEARAQRIKHLMKLKLAYSEWLANAAASSIKPTVSIPSKSFCSTPLSSTQPLMSSAPMNTIIQQHNSSVYPHPLSLPPNTPPTSYPHPLNVASPLPPASQLHFTPLTPHSSSATFSPSTASWQPNTFLTPLLFTPSLSTASPPITHVHSPLSTQSFSTVSQLDYTSLSTTQKKYPSPTSRSHLPLLTSYQSTASFPTPHSSHDLVSPLSTVSPLTSHSDHNRTSTLSTVSPPILHSYPNLISSLSTASPRISHSHFPLAIHSLSTTAPVEERESISQQLCLGLSGYRSHSPVVNKFLESAVPNHPGKGELPGVENHILPFLPSSLSKTPSTISSMDQVVVSCDNCLAKHSPTCQPLVPCYWSLSSSNKSDTFKRITEANRKSPDKKVEILEEDQAKEEEGEKKEEDDEYEEVVVAEVAENEVVEVEKKEDINLEEEEVNLGGKEVNLEEEEVNLEEEEVNQGEEEVNLEEEVVNLEEEEVNLEEEEVNLEEEEVNLEEEEVNLEEEEVNHEVEEVNLKEEEVKLEEEEVNLEEEEVAMAPTHKTHPLPIDLNTISATSGASITHFSQESPQNEPAHYTLPCSSSHHMSAYLKLVGKCNTKINSPTSSLTSEGSNLENYLLDVVEGSTAKGGVESEAPFLVGSSLTKTCADTDYDVEGAINGRGKARISANFTAPLDLQDGGGETTRGVIMDITSLKRRMGLVSSSDDESVVSYGKGNPNNPESPYEQEEDEFDFFT